MQGDAGGRRPGTLSQRTAILVAAAIEALVLIPLLLYLIFGQGR